MTPPTPTNGDTHQPAQPQPKPRGPHRKVLQGVLAGDDDQDEQDDQPRPKRGGRKHGLTPEVLETLCAAVKNGNTMKNACALSNISERTFFRWLAAGEKTQRGIKWQLCQSLKRALAEAEQRAVLMVQVAAKKNWQAAAWFLERRNPQAWGRTDTVNQRISGPDGGPVKVDSPLSGEAIASAYRDRIEAQVRAEIAERGVTVGTARAVTVSGNGKASE